MFTLLAYAAMQCYIVFMISISFILLINSSASRLVVNEMHFVNHNVAEDEQFKNTNTEASEKTFHFIANYHYTATHISHEKYNLFM